MQGGRHDRGRLIVLRVLGVQNGHACSGRSSGAIPGPRDGVRRGGGDEKVKDGRWTNRLKCLVRDGAG